MAAMIVLTLCACAFFESALTQCLGREPIVGANLGNPYGWPYDGFGPFDGFGGPAWSAAGCGLGSPPSGPAASYGGGLAVTSTSPIAPTGLTVNSENVIEGTVSVVGQLPFLGAVATDGAFATVGAGAVSYGCGDGAVGIVAEAPISPVVGPAVSGMGYGPVPASYGFGPMAGYNPNSLGCGCGMY